jgi:hypothetical protein
MNPRKSPLCFAALSLTFVGQARADDWLGARSLGRGGTGLADGDDAAAVGVNVASVALAERYDIVAGGVRGPDDTWLGRIAAADSRTSVVTLGATYTYIADNVTPTGASLPGWIEDGDVVDNPTTHQGVSLGLAYPFLGRKMAIGVTGRYDWRASENDGNQSGFNFGASVSGRPTETLTLAAGIQNVLDLDYADTRRLVDFGVRWQPGPYLALEGQLRTEWMGDPFEESLAEHAGVDVFAVQWLALRAGWQHEDGAHQVGGGVGLVSDKATIDYSLSGEIGSADPLRLWHGLDLRVHF